MNAMVTPHTNHLPTFPTTLVIVPIDGNRYWYRSAVLLQETQTLEEMFVIFFF